MRKEWPPSRARLSGAWRECDFHPVAIGLAQLDSVNAEAMMSLIATLVHERGVAAIVSTHDPRMAAHADRILEIHDGVVGRRRGRHALDTEPDGEPVVQQA